MTELINCLNANNINWAEFERLLVDCDIKKNAEFNSKIVASSRQVLGWYIPNLRKIAKSVRRENILKVIDNMPLNFYEETILVALFLGRVNNLDDLESRLSQFVRTIDNWATCDILCGDLKIVKNHRLHFWELINLWIGSGAEFVVRVGIVLMMKYYLDDEYIDRVLSVVSKVNSEFYYVNMALGWLYAEACVEYGEKIVLLLKNSHINIDVVKFTKGKVRDSFRVPAEIKQVIKFL